VIFVILLSLAAGAILELAMSSYRLSKRNEIRARARVIAESELEVFYYKFRESLIMGNATSAAAIPAQFAALGSGYVWDNSATPVTAGTPYLQIYKDNDVLDTTNLEKDDWIVRRSIMTSGSLIGTIPDTHKTGTFSFLTVRIMVEPGPSSPFYGKVSVKIGRRMGYATASLFQYNVFFQGDMEFAPGGNTLIEGDIAANGSIYMGASGGGTLTVSGYTSYLSGGVFNSTIAVAASADGTTPAIPAVTTYRKPGTLMPGTLSTPVTADTSTLSAPIFSTSESAQVSAMTEAENLLGGQDAVAIATRNPELFGALDVVTGEPTDAALNNVYRALIAPPPSALAAALGSSTDANSSEYPAATNLSSTADDESIAALRAYNRAGLIITVNGAGAVASITDGAGTDYLAAITPAVTSSTLFDQREGKSVAITNIDVGALKTALETAVPGFNGLLYVLLANSSETSPAAVRLSNAAITPGTRTPDALGNPTSTTSGFTVATNGGLYVKGDYNTTTSDGTSAISNTYTGKINPTLLMADSITVLSSAWDDANSTELGTASTSTSNISARVAASGQTTINSAILTGNTSADSVLEGDAAATASGGGQNLIRYMENWNGRSVTLRGSLGRLFDSRHFTSTFQQPGNAYLVPGLRTFAFNAGLKTDHVPGEPLITYYSRGDFFNW
jgi:hypothetical protein